MQKLTSKQRLFVLAYLGSAKLNATRAAIEAGYSEKTARVIGVENLSKPAIAAAIQEAMEARIKRAEVTSDEILREVDAIATADANGIVEFRRECCRYCHGVGHAYQFKTLRELEAKRRDHVIELRKARASKVPKAALPVFDESGGIGFDHRRSPHPDCPECLGEGYGRMFIHDTRNLPPDVRALYGGMKQTKEGIEPMVHSKLAALQLSMRHRGLLKDKLEVEVTEKLSDRINAARARARAGRERAGRGVKAG